MTTKPADEPSRMEQLTNGELKIIRALNRLDKLWKNHGGDLTLFNGNSLRKGGVDSSSEILTFTYIKGDGGDGGDLFK